MAAQPAVAGAHTAQPAVDGVVQVTSGSGAVLATFTVGSRSVVLTGASRTFDESTAGSKLVTTSWVRVLPSQFLGFLDDAWLTKALADTSPDALAIATQYMACAPPQRDANGMQFAGTAHYGPQESSGDPSSGADFVDYLGVSYNFPSGAQSSPRPADALSLDCSGFVRMVYGYRLGVPVDIQENAQAIPRRSFEILESAPGVVVIRDTGTQVTDYSLLLPGDLVFFDARTDDDTRIDHVGIYLGEDEAGHHRFASSRKSIDGPTLGDFDGPSILDGNALFARSFRAARRL